MDQMKTRQVVLIAAAMVVAMTLASCSTTSEDELAVVEEPAGIAVKAQFSISIPLSSASGVTRQNAAVVQNAETIGSFRGINKIKMYPTTVDSSAISTTTLLGTPIQLHEILKPSGSSTTVNNSIPKDELTEGNNSVLYGDVSLETGTRSFLFYGKAIDTNANESTTLTGNDAFVYGVLDDSPLTVSATSAAGFQFSPVAITTATKSDAKRQKIAAYLTSIARAKSSAGLEWSASTGLNVKLAALYANFSTMEAGASKNVERAVETLYFAAKTQYGTNAVAKAVCDSISDNTYVSIDETAKTLTFLADDENAAFIGLAGYPSATDLLPDGAAVLTYDATSKTFSYVETRDDAASMNVTPISNFVYPSSLYYWVKSNIFTSNQKRDNLDFSPLTWDNSTAKITGTTDNKGVFTYFTDGTTISASTRAVLLKSPVQYGVGRLDIKVVGSGSTLDDNGLAHDDNTTHVNLSQIKLTGVLISGQRAVDWTFSPISTATEKTIYDNICISQSQSNGLTITSDGMSSVGVMNHTLVLETPGAADECVNVALEFVNNGVPFWGKDGIIPCGCKFYLVGQLDMSASSIPAADKAKVGNKVFKQDYKTLAEFTITNLKKAQYHVPDLRNPEISVGLSVDLHWETGVTFTHTFN